jgi:hypothetical protein
MRGVLGRPASPSGAPRGCSGARDFNVTDREPGYVDLSEGLVDAHAEIGQGPGSSWRPRPLKGLPLGILRIDYLFSANHFALSPSSQTACPGVGTTASCAGRSRSVTRRVCRDTSQQTRPGRCSRLRIRCASAPHICQTLLHTGVT